MKTTTAIPILLIGTALLAGCSSTPAVDKEALYLKLVHDNTASPASDADLIALAEAACGALESGSSVRDVSMVIASKGYDASMRDELSKIVGYGIGQYCPELGGQK